MTLYHGEKAHDDRAQRDTALSLLGLMTGAPHRTAPHRTALTSDGCWVIGLSSSYDTIGSFAHALRFADSDFHRTPAGTERVDREATIGAEMAWRGRVTIVRARPGAAARAMSGRRAERATDMLAGRRETRLTSRSEDGLTTGSTEGLTTDRHSDSRDAGWRAPE